MPPTVLQKKGKVMATATIASIQASGRAIASLVVK